MLDSAVWRPQLRSRWGIYKNLLAGVTTVAHHGEPLEIENPLITVLQDAQSLHSVKFEKYWQLRLNNFLNNFPPFERMIRSFFLIQGTGESIMNFLPG